MYPSSTPHLVKALLFLVAVALFPMNTSAATSRAQLRNCKNSGKGCSNGTLLSDDLDETKASKNLRTSWEDDSALGKKRREARKRRQPKSVPSGEVTRTVHYGTITVLGDLLFILTFIGSASSAQHSIWPVIGTTLAPLGYLVVAPIIHTYYGEFGSAFKSFAFRLGFPVLGGIGGFVLGLRSFRAGDGNFLAPLISGATGVVSGVASASLIDVIFLAKTTKSANNARSFAAIPSLSISPRGTFTFGLAGHF